MAGLQKELASAHRVFAVDLPGHGETAPVTGPATFAVYARIVSEFLEQHELREVTLIGHSMGGVLGVLTGGLSNRVARVVNLDGAMPLTPAGREGYKLLPRHIEESGFHAAVETFIRQAFFLPTEHGAIMESIVADMLAMPEKLAHELLVQFPTLDAGTALRQCRVPLLYIGSAHPRFDQAAALSLRPDIAFAQVPSGHFLQIFALSEIVATVRPFMEYETRNL